MTLKHKDATANITIEGLAICCFNVEAGRRPKHWEIGFLRQPEHELILQIDKQSPVGIGRNVQTIRIETEKGISPDYDSKYVRGYHDVGKLGAKRRKEPKSQSTDAQENFRWVLDVESDDDVPHGDVTLHRPSYGATVAYIYDAVFYTLDQTYSPLYMVPLGQDPKDFDQAQLDACEKGWTSRRIQADIRCEDDGKIIITLGDKKIPLNSRPGDPWKISLTNMRPHHHVPEAPADETANAKAPASEEDVARPKLNRGDFQLYYDAMDVTGQKVALWGEPDPQRSGRVDCDSVRVSDIMDLNDLLP